MLFAAFISFVELLSGTWSSFDVLEFSLGVSYFEPPLFLSIPLFSSVHPYLFHLFTLKLTFFTLKFFTRSIWSPEQKTKNKVITLRRIGKSPYALSEGNKLLGES